VTLPTAQVSEEWLLRRYLHKRDLVARERLVQSMLPLARRVVASYGRRRFDQDLVQAALFGLTKAIDRWDESRGVPLRSYAIPTMHGEIRRWLRDQSWAVHVARPLQERVLAVSRTVEALQSRSGRSPTAAEIAAALSLDEEAVIDALQAGRAYDAMALDMPLAEAGGDTLLDLVGDDDARFERIEEIASLRTLRGLLDARERRLLHLRFVDDLSQSQIAASMGCSQMQVSRLLRATLDRLRAAANGEPDRRVS
jgi:RNA polymerase sigma-B factor